MIKNIIICLFFILLVASCDKQTVIEKNDIKFTDVIAMNRAEVSSIAGVGLDSRWESLSSILNIDIEDIRDNVLNKSLTIEGFNARLVIFTGSSNIYQVSLLVEQSANEEDIALFFEAIDKEIKKRISVIPSINIIENDDGSILEKNIIYSFAHKTFFVNIGSDYISVNIAGNSNIL